MTVLNEFRIGALHDVSKPESQTHVAIRLKCSQDKVAVAFEPNQKRCKLVSIGPTTSASLAPAKQKPKDGEPSCPPVPDDLDSPGPSAVGSLAELSANGSIDEVKAAMAGGYNPDGWQETGDRKSPLVAAASNSRVDVCEVLLGGGGDPNLMDGNGTLPILAAIRAGAENAVEALLRSGAEVRVHDSEGRTPMSEAWSLNQHRCIAVLNRFGAPTSEHERAKVVGAKPEAPEAEQSTEAAQVEEPARDLTGVIIGGTAGAATVAGGLVAGGVEGVVATVFTAPWLAAFGLVNSLAAGGAAEGALVAIAVGANAVPVVALATAAVVTVGVSAGGLAFGGYKLYQLATKRKTAKALKRAPAPAGHYEAIEAQKKKAAASKDVKQGAEQNIASAGTGPKQQSSAAPKSDA